jgi:hypothetical protein
MMYIKQVHVKHLTLHAAIATQQAAQGCAVRHSLILLLLLLLLLHWIRAFPDRPFGSQTTLIQGVQRGTEG